MSNQIVISSGAKVRELEGVLTGTAGIVSSVPLGAANGVATLDSGGKVPVSQLPASVVTYLGTWNAATNTPTLTNGVGDAGDMYICNVAGTVNFGAGPITFAVGDWVLYGSGTWQKSSGQNGTVTSVGASITGNAIGLTGSPITTAGTLAFAFAGTAAQYINGAGNLVTFPTTIAQAQRLITEVYNETGATLTKGTVVYINGGHGNLPTVTKAIATGDSTSAQTYGVVQTDITNMNNGYVVVIGSLGDLDTQAYANGTQLYLSSTTAGAWTSTKQYAPAHLVYVGIVVRSHPTQGVVEVRIQNGFELDELHNVSAQTPSNNQGLFYNSSNQLWENKSIATALGYTPANDASVVHLTGNETIGGTKTFSDAPKMDGSLFLKIGATSSTTGYMNLGGRLNGIRFTSDGGTSNDFNLPSLTGYSFTFPNATGTIALLEFSQTFSGLQSFTNTAGTDLTYGAYLTKNSIPSAFSSSTVNLYSASGNNNLVIRDNGNTSKLQFQATSSYTYTFPASTGTLALTTDIPSITGLVPYTGATGAVNLGFNSLTTNSINLDGNSASGVLNIKSNTTVTTAGASYVSLVSGNVNQLSIWFGAGNMATFTAVSLSTSRTYTLPNASGTVALTSDLTGGTVTSVAALTIGTSGTDLSSSVANSTTTPVITLNVPTASATNRGVLSSADWTTFNNKQNALTNPVTGTGTTNYLPKFTGTSTIGNSAITDDGSSITLGLSQTTFGTTGSKFYVYPAFSTNLNLLQNYNGSAYTTEEHRASDYSFKIGTTTGLILNASGNLGLGVTPSAWGSILNVNQFGNYGAFIAGRSDSVNQVFIGVNAYYNGTSWLYSNNSTASRYYQDNGKHIWDTAPSGTAGNAISFTQAMTLFSTGNLAVGTTTDAGYKLDVNGTGRFTSTLTVVGNAIMGAEMYRPTTDSYLRLNGGGSGVDGATILMFGSTHPTAAGRLNLSAVGSESIILSAGGATRLTIASTGAATFSSSVTAGGGITTNGNYANIRGGDTYLWFTENGVADKFLIGSTVGSNDLVFRSGAYNFSTGTERMRITSGGNVGIGNGTAFTPSNLLSLDITSADQGIILITRSNGATNSRWGVVNQGVNNTAYIGTFVNNAFAFYSNSSERMRIESNGNVLIGTTSDAGYKLYVDGGSSNGMLFYSTSAANQIKAAGTAPAITFSNTITSPTIGGSLGSVTAANQFLTGTAAGDMILINQFTGNKLYITNYSGGVYLTQGATSWTANSDIRLKNINSYIENAVEKLSTLQTINFSYKDDKTNKQNLGLIAQEVEKIFPELIDKNGDGMLGVRYTELVPVLIKAVQELKLEIETLKNK